MEQHPQRCWYQAAIDALLLGATQSCLSPVCSMVLPNSRNLGLVLTWGAHGIEGMTDGHQVIQSSVQLGSAKMRRL